MSDVDTDPEGLYTPLEAATQFFKVKSDYILRKGAREGRFPHTRVGRRIRFTREQLETIAALLSTGGPPPAARPKRARRTVTAEELGGLPVTARSANRHAHG